MFALRSIKYICLNMLQNKEEGKYTTNKVYICKKYPSLLKEVRGERRVRRVGTPVNINTVPAQSQPGGRPVNTTACLSS